MRAAKAAASAIFMQRCGAPEESWTVRPCRYFSNSTEKTVLTRKSGALVPVKRRGGRRALINCHREEQRDDAISNLVDLTHCEIASPLAMTAPFCHCEARRAVAIP